MKYLMSFILIGCSFVSTWVYANNSDPNSFLKPVKGSRLPVIAEEKIPAYLIYESGVVYTPGPDTNERELDILYHADHKTAKRPAIVVLHGGGWRKGDISKGHEIIAIYATQGYVTISINYRLSGTAIAPAAVHDCKLAIRWTRANAEKYGIDPDRIGCIGGSAGGHLTAMMAVTDPSDGLDGPYLEAYSSSVQAAMPLSGLYDLRESDPLFIDPFLGGEYGSRKKGLTDQMSPTVLVRPEKKENIPPMLIVHSVEDRVDIKHFNEFVAALTKIGRKEETILVPGEGHGHVLIRVPEVRKAADKFFRQHLEPQPPVVASNVASGEVRPGVFRTPDERFENLEDYPFAPHYLEVDSKVGKLRMHYVDVGPRNADPVLLMHGEPSWSYLYRNMIPQLVAAGHRVIAPDLIGFGKSDKPAKRTDHSYQNHVDWIMQFVTELDLQNVTLFCQDWGSLIGLRIVTGAPDRFARVVAGNAALPAGKGDDGIVIGGEWTQPDPNVELMWEEGFMPWLKYSQTVPELNCGVILQAATVRELTEAELDAYRAPFPDERYAAGARVMPTLVRSQQATNRNAWKVLQEFDRPFLTTFSDSDPVTSKGERIFQKRVPGAKGQPHTIIKRAGHFLQEDASEQLATLINSLIAANPTPATSAKTHE